MKLHKSQTGFTALHVLLFLVIVGIIGFAGWKVYDANKSTKVPSSNATTPVVKKADSKIPEGYVEHKDDTLGISFAYPKDWQEVPINQNDKKYGLILRLVSPAQKKAYEDFAKLNKATEGPYNFDLDFSEWDSINNENAKGGSYLGEPASYTNLEDYLTHPNSSKQKVGEFNIGNQKIFEVQIAGFSQSCALMFEKPNGNIYELRFINIGGKSELDQTAKKIIESIQIF